jgi:ribosomal protein S27E
MHLCPNCGNKMKWISIRKIVFDNGTFKAPCSKCGTLFVINLPFIPPAKNKVV